MGIGAFVEPVVVLSLLVGGTLVNRRTELRQETPRLPAYDHGPHHKRELRFLSWRATVVCYNTRRFRDRWLSRCLQRFPFLIEVLYWALIYWVYQLGRAFTAVTLVDGTIRVAHRHALELIHIEKQLGIFWELPIQSYFLARPTLLHWINRVYSYVHIPGSIFFLIWLFYTTTPRKSLNNYASEGPPASPTLYEARRRTMAVCNLLAFFVFTTWPCMPPRLLSSSIAEDVPGTRVEWYGFVDTVHGKSGESSVWTQNRFCNQYAAMPSLHFGYSLLVGLTVATLPLSQQACRRFTLPWSRRKRLRLPSVKRLACVTIGLSYIITILVAIIATANHFILDAVAGAVVCAAGWYCNGILLNLRPLEDFLFWCLRAHKPEQWMAETLGEHVGIDGVENAG